MIEIDLTAADILIPGNDTLRINKLHEYQILDTHSEDTFDKIAVLAAQIFETPSAFITFVDKDRVFFKANISDFDGNIAAREKSPCALAILKDDYSVIYDTFDHPYLKDSPLVTCEGGIRFYAASPLKTPEGFLLGTLCVADSQPRTIKVTDKQLEMLKSLSEIVINKLESRLRYKKLLKSQNDLMNMTLHEIKNPLASINLANDVARKDPTKAEKMALMIKQGVARIQTKLGDLLKHSEMEEEELQLNIEETDLQDLLTYIIKNFELQASRKRQVIHLKMEDKLPKIFIDSVKISDVFHNLLSNAIKYSYYDTEINILVRRENNRVCIEFKDQGQGLEAEDLDRLFMKFARLSAKPTGKETSNGMGLSICKSLVDMHHGEIYAKSKGKDDGATFIVKLPMLYEIEKEPEIIGL